MLRQAGDQGVPSGQFAEAGILRFGQRLAEIREAGYTVQTKRLASNRFRYFLNSAFPCADPTDDPAGAGSPSPEPRRRSFSYERPPSIVGRWQLVFDLRPGRERTHWERVDLPAQQELAA